MCGIVGHIGNKNSRQVIIEGLKRLEYRGYDSAGISYVENNQLCTLKEEGMVSILENSLNKINNKIENLDNVTLAIGHTRWATHGEVNTINAHPHSLGDYSLVHNGIVENAISLKKESSLSNYNFVSSTDTEVFLAVFLKNLKQDKNHKKAFLKTYNEVKGHSAFVMLCKKENSILAIRSGAPLVCGLGKNNFYVSSDPFGLVNNVDEILFPENEVLCELTSSGIKFYDLNLDEIEKSKIKVQQQKLIGPDMSKAGFDHFMLKEIFEQPSLIQNLFNYYFEGEGKKLLLQLRKNVHSEEGVGRYLFSACGTAAYAAYVIRDMFERELRVVSSVELASEFRYRNPIIKSSDVAIFISQSGETADTLAAQELCNKAEITNWSIVNVEESTLYRNADFNFPIKAGLEIGVASTKAFTQQTLVGYFLSKTLNHKNKFEEITARCKSEIRYLIQGINNLLDREDEIKKICYQLHSKKSFFYTGRGIYYPIALEGALKLKEIAYVHAEGYAAGELKHGPIALIDRDVVNIAFIGPELIDKTISNILEIKSRRGTILTVGDLSSVQKMSDVEQENQLKSEKNNFHFQVDLSNLKELSPILLNIFNQLFAYHIAKIKGTDIDKPRNLAKSVTVE